MRKNSKRLTIILIVITIIVVVLLIITDNKNKSIDQSEKEIQKEEFIDILDDGTKLNTSDQLQKMRTLEGLDIMELQLTEKDNQTVLIGIITNNLTTQLGGYLADITLLDKQGNEMTTTQTYIPPLTSGQSTKLKVTIESDYANAYDVTIANAE